MEFFHRAGMRPSSLGILPGTFNPITVAHLALAESAVGCVDEVLFVLPRVLPHKEYTGATFEQRVAMLLAATAGNPAFSVAAVDGGLFLEIAEECREAYGERVSLSFLCGRDAAERIVGWDYGRPGVVEEMLRSFDLLVASRSGEYIPPGEFRDAIRPLELPGDFDEVSATQVRERIARGLPWEHLVPAAIVHQVRTTY